MLFRDGGDCCFVNAKCRRKRKRSEVSAAERPREARNVSGRTPFPRPLRGAGYGRLCYQGHGPPGRPLAIEHGGSAALAFLEPHRLTDAIAKEVQFRPAYDTTTNNDDLVDLR